MAESIVVPPARNWICSFFEEHANEQSNSSSAQQRSVIGEDSYQEDATYIDSSSILMKFIDPEAEDGDDDDLNVYHEDPPADFGPMVEEN